MSREDAGHETVKVQVAKLQRMHTWQSQRSPKSEPEARLLLFTKGAHLGFIPERKTPNYINARRPLMVQYAGGGPQSSRKPSNWPASGPRGPGGNTAPGGNPGAQLGARASSWRASQESLSSECVKEDLTLVITHRVKRKLLKKLKDLLQLCASQLSFLLLPL